MNDFCVVGEMLLLNILPTDINIENGNKFGELARQNVRLNENTLRILRNNNKKCYVSDIISVFQSLCCSNCDTFFINAPNLERYLAACSEQVKNVYCMNVYQIQETFFDKQDSFENH